MAAEGQHVTCVEGELRHRRVDGVRSRPVDRGAATGYPVRAARLGAEQERRAQVLQLRVLRRVAVRVDARELHDAVPDVAVRVVGGVRRARQRGHLQQRTDAQHEPRGCATGQPRAAQRDHAEHEGRAGDGEQQQVLMTAAACRRPRRRRRGTATARRARPPSSHQLGDAGAVKSTCGRQPRRREPGPSPP